MPVGTLTALGLGAGLGGLVGGAKHALVDAPKYEAKKKLAAETIRNSPWTGLTAQVPDQPSAFENVIGGAGYGLSAINPLNKALGGGLLEKTAELPTLTGTTPQAPKQYNLGLNTTLSTPTLSSFGLDSPMATHALNTGGMSPWEMMMLDQKRKSNPYS